MNSKLISLLVLAFLFAIAVSQDASGSGDATPSVLPWDAKGLADEWAAFKAKFQKAYDSVLAEIKAFQNWLAKRQASQAGNSDTTKTWTEGETQFSDLSNDEFVKTYCNLKIPQDKIHAVRGTSDASQLPAAPASVNWVTQGKVTPVKNQGGCGSCWAFATIGSIEALRLITGGAQEIYSEQALVDCTANTGVGCSACQGGWPAGAMGWISTNGVTPSTSYPYKGVYQGGNSCPSLPKSSFKIYGAGSVAQGNTDELARACAFQPVTVCVDATNFGSYTGGVFSNCGTAINHAVLLVGYTDQYWIIKNSWGASWGESGYIRIAKGNTCGIANYAYYPLKDVPAKIDKDPNCSSWKAYCQSNSYVIQNCLKTCA
jgi:C1A family cysteine protease